MGRMVDVIFISTTHVAGVDQVEDPKQDARYGQDHIEVDLLKRGKKDIGKYHRWNSPWCSQCTVFFIIAVSGNGSKRGQGDTCQVEQDKEKGTRKDRRERWMLACLDVYTPRPPAKEKVLPPPPQNRGPQHNTTAYTFNLTIFFVHDRTLLIMP